MAEIQHLAICTKNNRRLARFYQLIFGLEEAWNRFQNSPYAFYMSDGYLNLNCLQIRPGSSYNRIVDGQEIMPDVGINHIGFTVKSVKDIEQRLSSLNPPVKLVASPQDGRYEEWRITDPDGTLASFYKSALPIREVNRVIDPTGEARAIFLSAGKTALGLLKKTSANKNGFERVGFQVGSIDEIKKRLRNAPTYLYPGEPEVSVMTAPSGDPGKSLYLKDPDGNIVELSEEGWIA
jgi:catechol 2,3-dioxygenase-like lactoylglutathione lyase family enzyme